ncbi:hypothetical protein AK812_SmicGene41735 [Symbiodinium microadriaticum]|uniref:Uncharacterized protein n=1 Tax=Symbiodinium microadriaticum TaxID=2951 RepID=A0A1Q9C5C4_SYMMI|nr:hypothetical protein AK812_SmicGene41735 [Symbiodinium microadriaticum]CAE7500106.1 unnamed protein product [Symbiodinium microadriaticum]CAE7861474.1 unnamed protein product [Symbiodinium sp. KB8]
MGGKSNKRWQRDYQESWRGNQYYEQDSNWQLWQGSYSVSPKARAKAAARPPARYDMVTPEEPSASSTDSGGMRRMLQKALSTARKADTRLRKIKELIALRRKQWEKFEKDSKAYFLSQKRQFEQEIKRLENEIATVTDTGTGAERMLQQIVLQTATEEAETDEPDDMSWEQLMQDQEEEIPGFLNEMMRRLRPARRDGAPPSGAEALRAERPESGRPAEALPSSYIAEVPPREPFSSSPGNPTTTHGLAATGASPPGHATRRPARTSRTPIKARPPPEPPALGSVTLGDKLAAKRQALKPFGGNPGTAGAPSAAAAGGVRGTEETDRPPDMAPAEVESVDEEMQQAGAKEAYRWLGDAHQSDRRPQLQLNTGHRFNQLRTANNNNTQQMLILCRQRFLLVLFMAAPEIGCEADEALGVLSSARVSAASEHFDCLLPAFPQPSREFASILAMPDWVVDKCVILVDSRLLDGRLFAIEVDERLNRSSFLLHVDIEDVEGLQVIHEQQDLAAVGLHHFMTGATVVIVPAGQAMPSILQFEEMLRDENGWQLPCPLFGTRDERLFYAMSDGGHALIALEEGWEHGSDAFKTATALQFQYSRDSTTVCPSLPCVSDMELLGRNCESILVSTEAISRLPIPPGRVIPQQHIAFIDARSMLRNFTWRLAQFGYLDIEHLTREFQRIAPIGYEVHVKGGQRGRTGDRCWLYVSHGMLLSIELFPVDKISEEGNDDASDSGRQEDSESEPREDDSRSSSVQGQIARADVTTTDRQNARDGRTRSRSPRRNAAPTGVTVNTVPPNDGEAEESPAEPRHAVQAGSRLACDLESTWPLHSKEDAVRPGCAKGTSGLIGAGLALEGFFGPLVVRLSSNFGQRECWLGEPACDDDEQRRRLDDLRFVTVDLGGDWPYIPADGWGGIPHNILQDVLEAPLQATEMRRIAVRVLKPLYVPEKFGVWAQLPATPFELLRTVQEARDPTYARSFPSLRESFPQTVPGVCVVIATPEWLGFATIVCLDLLAIDGRLFAVQAPDYLGRQGALMLADLPPMADIHVYAGHEEAPMSDQAHTHIHAGLVLKFVPADIRPAEPCFLSQLLLSHEYWDRDNAIPEPEESCYCLVLRYGFRLFFADQAQPQRFRERVAESTGCDLHNLSITPADPRVLDAAVDGHVCRTVLAAIPNDFIREAGALFCIVVDCRQLLQGWMCFRVPSHNIIAEDILGTLNEEAPLGWRTSIDGILTGYTRLQVAAGQVLTARYVVDEGPRAAAVPETPFAWDTTTFDQQWGHPQSSEGGSASDHSLPEEDEASIAQSKQVTFCLLVPDYATEYIDVELDLPIDVSGAISAIAQARSSDAALFFPRIFEAFPQPHMAFAVAVAVPPWPAEHGTIVIDGSLVDGRLFALHVAPTTNRRSLLTAAGYDPDADLHVYFRDCPWPMANRERVQPASGDLIVVAPLDHVTLFAASLSDMLQSAEGWVHNFRIGVAEDAITAVVVDQGVLRIPHASHDWQAFSESIAGRLGLDTTQLTIHKSVPNVDDFSDRGFPSRQLYAAWPNNSPEASQCVLDLRPLGLGLHLYGLSETLLDCARFLARFDRTCPLGFLARLSGGRPGVAVPPGFREVHHGDVLHVFFDSIANLEEGDEHMEHDYVFDVNSMSDPDVCDAPSRSWTGLPLLAVSHGPGYDREARDLRMSGSLERASRRRSGTRGRSPLRTCLLSVCLFSCLEVGMSAGTTFETGVEEVPCAAGEQVQVFAYPGRPLPTPCRAFASATAGPDPAISWELFELELGPTLLEEALEVGAGDAFFEARVIVEVLHEEYEARRPPTKGSEGKGESAQRVHTLKLDSLISPELAPVSSEAAAHFRMDVGQCVLPCSAEDVFALLATCPFRVLDRVPDDVPKPERFWRWLRNGEPGRSPLPHERLVLTADGSFHSSSGSAGWGLVVSIAPSEHQLPGQFVGCTFGPFLPEHKGDAKDVSADAFLAEVLGLAWAGILALRLPFTGHVVCRADNISALKGVQGEIGMPAHPICVLARSLHLTLQISRAEGVQYEHVKGHDGDHANELADGLANLGAGCKRGFPFSPFDFDFWLRQGAAAARWLPHVSLSILRPGSLPALRENIIEWELTQSPAQLSSRALIAPFTRELHNRPILGDGKINQLGLRCATYNALSLLSQDIDTQGAGGLYGAAGRTALLDQSLHEHGIHIAGVQEARTPAGRLPSDHFVRYCSGCTARKALGVELWIASGSSFPPHKAVILYADHTRLCARVSFDHFRLQILVGHAPHRAHTAEERRLWWMKTKEVCGNFPHDDGWMLLLDANCRVGSVNSSSIGEWQPDVEDDGGEYFHALLVSLQDWLPCTFEATMHGAGGTLLQRSSGELQRCDFVAVPLSWQEFETCAWVEPRITAGHSSPDHFAAVTQCRLVYSQGGRRAKSRRIDPVAIQDPSNAEKIRHIIASFPVVPWQVNLHDHAALLSEYLFQNLAHHFPLRARRMRKSFLSSQAGEVHVAVAEARHALRGRVNALNLARLRCAFDTWRRADVVYEQLVSCRWSARLQTVIALLSTRVGELGKVLRNVCRRDKKQYLRELATDVGEAPATEVHVALRRVLRPKKFRRNGPNPLPMLKRDDGTICASEAEVRGEWRRHFGDLEGGECVECSALVDACMRRQLEAGAFDSLQCADIPDLAALTDVFRKVQPGKAAGPDHMPPSICRRFSSSLALAFWPLLLKSIVFCAEPAGYKGGTLFHIPKAGQGANVTCTADRGILVQSIFEKVFHKALRGSAMQGFERRAKDMQIGGRKGLSFAIGCFSSRAFLQYARAQGLSAGILFCDLKAAYYAVVRELLVGGGLSDATLEDITASLHLTNEDLQILSSYVEEDAIITDETDGSFLSAMAREIHSSTWFWLQNDDRIVHTRRGTRPGSSWADVMFGILFARVLERRGDFSDRDLLPQIPWSGQRELVPFDARRKQQQQISIQDIIYADDLATCILTQEPQALPRAIQHVAGTQIDTLTEHGLQANIGPRKTAAVIAPLGSGARKVRYEVFTIAKGKLPVLCENRAGLHLDAVASYRHLGAVITHNGAMQPEIRSRLNQARLAFKEGRKLVFCSPCIPLGRRVFLFRVYVLASLFAGSGAWPRLNDATWKTLEAGVTSMLRQVLRIPYDGKQNWSHEQIYGAAELPGVRGLVAMERLRFLSQLYCNGPDAAFALLQHSRPALQAFWDAMDWMVQAVENTSHLRRDNWESWTALFRDKGRFKGLLKRASAWHVGRLQAVAAFQTFCRSRWHAMPPAVVDVETAQHACLVCRIAFFDFHSWSAHAAKTHGYRSRANRHAVGLRCRACGAVMPSLASHRRHLQTHVGCCRAVEWELKGLLPPLMAKDGHLQAVVVEGTGLGHLPETPPDVSVPLLRSLRTQQFESDTSIFEHVVTFFEPLHVLRATLGFWIQGLEEGAVKNWAEDALLCMQADLWCDSASRIRQVPEDTPAIFRPMLVPVPLRGEHLSGVQLQVSEVPPDPSRASDCLTFANFWNFEGDVEVASIEVVVPAPPVAATDLCDFASCPLVAMRQFLIWLTRVFVWTDAVMTVAEKGRHASIRFHGVHAGPLAGWLSETVRLTQGSPALSFGFTF